MSPFVWVSVQRRTRSKTHERYQTAETKHGNFSISSRKRNNVTSLFHQFSLLDRKFSLSFSLLLLSFPFSFFLSLSLSFFLVFSLFSFSLSFFIRCSDFFPQFSFAIYSIEFAVILVRPSHFLAPASVHRQIRSCHRMISHLDIYSLILNLRTS